MRKKPTLSVFLDGLGYDSIEYMPFLNSFNTYPLYSMFGYSVTCHATMYTGLYPEDHGLLFIWKRSPETSPFKGLNLLNDIPGLNNQYIKYLITKFYKKTKRYSSYFGIPRIGYLPYKYWPQFDVSEKKFWNEDGYISPHKTLFEIIRENNLIYSIIGMDKKLHHESYFVDSQDIPEGKDWIYLFMGDPDHFTHQYTKYSSFLKAQLFRIDRLLEKKYHQMKDIYGDFYFIVWSDHGQLTIKERIDPYALFSSFGVNLNNYLHAVEATIGRFWYKNNIEKKTIENILLSLPCGNILNNELQKKYNVRIKDKFAWGDIIFQLNGGCVFSKTLWGNTNKVKSTHGYLPDEKNYQGVLITNFSNDILLNKRLDLTHILPIHKNIMRLS